MTLDEFADFHARLCSDWNNPNGRWLVDLEEYERTRHEIGLVGTRYDDWIKERFLIGGSSGAARNLVGLMDTFKRLKADGEL